MSSTLARYIVLGYFTFLCSQSPINASPITSDLQAAIGTRPDGYTYTPGIGAHKVHSRLANWNTARRTCEEEGAYLGIINSVAEATAVVQLFNESNVHGVWVGLHDYYQEDEFVTIHGEPVAQTGFNNWHPGEPNNAGNNEQCVVLKDDAIYNDLNCANRLHFVCELPYVHSEVVLKASR